MQQVELFLKTKHKMNQIKLRNLRAEFTPLNLKIVYVSICDMSTLAGKQNKNKKGALGVINCSVLFIPLWVNTPSACCEHARLIQ